MRIKSSSTLLNQLPVDLSGNPPSVEAIDQIASKTRFQFPILGVCFIPLLLAFSVFLGTVVTYSLAAIGSSHLKMSFAVTLALILIYFVVSMAAEAKRIHFQDWVAPPTEKQAKYFSNVSCSCPGVVEYLKRMKNIGRDAPTRGEAEMIIHAQRQWGFMARQAESLDKIRSAVNDCTQANGTELTEEKI